MGAVSILVTGSHRSGSTWVGRTIARSTGRLYVDEPFNPEIRPWMASPSRQCWFERVDPGDPWLESVYTRSINGSLFLRFRREWLFQPRRYGSFFLEHCLAFKARHSWRGAVVKDPISLFSADILEDRFGLAVICLIRHPAAFVNSILKTQWRFRFADILNQDSIMERLPADLIDQMRFCAKQRRPLVAEASTLWNLFHFWIKMIQDQGRNWEFVTHEALSASTFNEYSKILARTGSYNPERLSRVLLPSQKAYRCEAMKPNDIAINSIENIKKWKKQMLTSEIKEVRKLTEKYSEIWYGDETW